MKKQIIYPRLIPRLFATSIDLFVLSVVLTPIMGLISPVIFTLFFNNFLTQQRIDQADQDAIAMAVRTPEFAQYIDAQNSSFFGYIALLFAVHALFMGMYFVGFWIYKGATLGKMLMRMKIVDTDTFEKPTKWQSIKRFLGYVTALLGIWRIAFSERRQALHDKIAHTVVIKV